MFAIFPENSELHEICQITKSLIYSDIVSKETILATIVQFLTRSGMLKPLTNFFVFTDRQNTSYSRGQISFQLSEIRVYQFQVTSGYPWRDP